jgi:putative endonuclease
MKAFYGYMMTNRSRAVLYTGITNSLMRRVSQHQNGEIEGFTKTYKVNRLVYYERFNDPRDEIARGKGNQRMAARKKELVGPADEPDVGRLVPDAFSAYAGSLAPLGMTKETV